MDKGGQSPCLSSMGECRELTEKGTEPSGSREFKTTRLAEGQLKGGWRERYQPSVIPLCGRCGSTGRTDIHICTRLGVEESLELGILGIARIGMAWRGRFCDRCGAGAIETAHDYEFGVCLEVCSRRGGIH